MRSAREILLSAAGSGGGEPTGSAGARPSVRMNAASGSRSVREGGRARVYVQSLSSACSSAAAQTLASAARASPRARLRPCARAEKKILRGVSVSGRGGEEGRASSKVVAEVDGTVEEAMVPRSGPSTGKRVVICARGGVALQ